MAKKQNDDDLRTHDIDEAIYLANRIVILKPRPGSIRSILRVLSEFEKIDELELIDSSVQ